MNREPQMIDSIANVEAENGLIGGLLLDNRSFDRISDRIKPEHFFTTLNRDIFTEMSRQILAGKSCDVVTVGMAMAGKVEFSQLNALAQYVPSTANMSRYADLIVERFKSRALLSVSAEVTELAHDHHRTIEDRVEAAQGLLVGLVDEAPRDEWISAYEGMVNHCQILEDRADGKNTAWATGLTDLDDYLEGGFRPGQLVIVGARPSMGKTALAMTIGLSMARDIPVAMLSMEMPHSEVRDRMTAMLGNVSLSHVKRPAKEFQWDRVMEGVDRAKNLDFHVTDQGGLNINQVRSKARVMKRKNGMKVLIVDYIGLMAGLDPKQQRTYQLEEVSRGLKTLAKELDMAVMCLAQVNRKFEDRGADAMPMLSDLKDCGAIEQDADVVIFIHRPIQAKPELGDEWKYYAKASVAKNRNGRCGLINLSYQGDQTKFNGWTGQAPSSITSKNNRGEL